MTGSSLTLGTAGSRRTVYLIDDNAAKIADSKNSSTSTSAAANNTNNKPTQETRSQSPQPENTSIADNPPASSTFLMFNRISNIIGGNINENSLVATPNVGGQNSTNNGSTIGGDKTAANNKDKKKNVEDGKETAIWYEYGCV